MTDTKPDELGKYLGDSYRRDVLGEAIAVEDPPVTAQLRAQVDAELARIDGLKLGAHLANRDFASYQNRKALIALRDRLKAVSKDVE
jgi:hypothetical protein